MSRRKVMASSSLTARFVVVMIATTLIMIATATSASAAIGVSSFSLTPSTTATGESPDLSISATRSGYPSDDVKQATIKLPAGAGYSVAAIGTKCSGTQFNADGCPLASKVGTASAQFDVGLFGTLTAVGEIYATAPASAGADLGIIYRPSGLSKILVKSKLGGTAAAGVTLTTGDYRRSVRLLGLFPIDITIQKLDFQLKGKSGATVIYTNPTTCAAATSTFTYTPFSGAAASRTASFAVTGCTPPEEKPVVTITSGPAVGSLTMLTTAAFDFSSVPSTVTFECKLDASAFSACSSGQSYDSLADGSHTFVVRAKNGAIYSDEVSRQWSVDATPPTAPSVVRTSPTANPTSSTSQTISITPAESGGTLTCTLDAAPFTPCEAGSVTATGLPDGAHTFAVFQTDAAGNAGSTASVVWSSGAPPPAAPTISSGPAAGGHYPTAFASFSFSSTSPGVTYECRIDSGSFAACASPASYGPLIDGSHTFYVRAKDAEDVVSAVTSRQWFAEVEPPPAPTVSTPPSGSTTAPVITFSGEAGATFQCSLNGAPFFVCTSPYTISSPLPPGAQTFAVRAVDAAGNVGSATTVSWYPSPEVPANTLIGDAPAASTSLAPQIPVTTDVGTSYECQVNNSGVWSPCDPNTGIYGAGVSFVDNAVNRIAIRATGGIGGPDLTPATTFLWISTADVSATASVTASDTRAGAHPTIVGTTTLNGGYNAKSVTVDMPLGLNGALTATSEKCDASGGDPEAMDCAVTAPGSAIGTLTGIGVASTAGSITDATSTIYLTTPSPDSSSPAGVWVDVKSPSHPELGHIRVFGWVNILQIDNGVINGETRQSITIPAIPERTSLGIRFHANSVSVELLGDPPGGTYPLITNPTTCDDHYFVGTGTTWSEDGFGGDGPAIPEVFVPYPVTDCDTLEFNPQLSQDFFMTDPPNGSTYDPLDPGSSVVNVGQALRTNLAGFRFGVAGTVATLTNGTPSTTARRAAVRETKVLQPQGTGANFAALAGNGATCPGSSASPTGIFDVTQCSPGAQVGTVSIATPLLESPLVGSVWLISNTPLPWLGVYVSPDTDANNPAGVYLSLTARTDLNCADTAPQCTDATYKRVTITLENLPDVPVDSVTLDLSGRTARALNNDGEASPGLLVAMPDQGSASCLASDHIYSTMVSGGGVVANGLQPTTMSGCVSVPGPSLVRTSPTGTTSNQATASFTINPDPAPPGWHYECRLDAGAWYPCSAGAQPPIGPLGDGLHSFAVRSVSDDGTEASSSATSHWRVDTVAPVLNVTKGASVSGNVTFAWTRADIAGSGFGTFTCNKDGAATYTTAQCSPTIVSPSTLSGTQTWPGIIVGSGSHTFCVRTTDVAGNETVRCVTWTA
ncbi:MAG: hypothetical protein JHC98_10310 [Thermoleophilaceae bacterium]|nr:hypothetical protein [Thermoleophilaceae bacterium]